MVHGDPQQRSARLAEVTEILKLEAPPEDLDLLNSVTDNIMGRTICALGDAASMPVKSFIKHFGAEFEYHIRNRKCLVPEDVQRAGSGFFKVA